MNAVVGGSRPDQLILLPAREKPKSGSCNVSYISEPLKTAVFLVISKGMKQGATQQDKNSTVDILKHLTVIYIYFSID